MKFYFFPARCWNCGKDNDLLNDLNVSRPPREGDGTICYSCCAIGIIEKGVIRKPTDQEVIESLEIPQVRKALHAISWKTNRLN